MSNNEKDMLNETEVESNEAAETEVVAVDEVALDSATEIETPSDVEISEESEVDGKGIPTKKSKKPKKEGVKRLKRWHIVLISIATVFAVIGTSVGIFFGVMMGKQGDPTPVDAAEMVVDMDTIYYVGTVNDIDLSVAFPGQKIGALDGDSATLEGNILKINGTADFTIKIGDITKEVKVVDKGVNVTTFDALHTAVNVDKVPVVVQVPKMATTYKEKKGEDGKMERNTTLYLNANAYGNGVHIDAHATAKSSSDGEFSWGNSGEAVFEVNTDDEITIRDFKLTGKDYLETDDLYTYTNYGSMLNIRGLDLDLDSTIVSPKANVNVIHNVFEKSHKVVHVINANVYFEGNIIRDASDTAVSIGAFPNQGSVINMKNNVVANSLTGGILFYNFSKGVTQANAAKSYSTLNITGFLDIYNWKDEAGLVFLPKTEERLLPKDILAFANGLAGSEIQKKEYDDMKAVFDDVETGETRKLIHFGILKIRTTPSDNKTNDSIVNGLDKVGFEQKKLPLMWPADKILTDMVVCGYLDNQTDAVKPTDKLDSNPNMYVQLREGRTA